MRAPGETITLKEKLLHFAVNWFSCHQELSIYLASLCLFIYFLSQQVVRSDWLQKGHKLFLVVTNKQTKVTSLKCSFALCKAAFINIFRLTMDEMTVHNVKGVTCRNPQLSPKK